MRAEPSLPTGILAQAEIDFLAEILISTRQPSSMVSTGRIESVFAEIHPAIDVIEINPNERIACRQG